MKNLKYILLIFCIIGYGRCVTMTNAESLTVAIAPDNSNIVYAGAVMADRLAAEIARAGVKL